MPPRRSGLLTVPLAVIGGLKTHYKDEGPRDAPVLFMVTGPKAACARGTA
ncbi:hypothetical protein [Novosphingobium sp. HII-3]|nr:hypothetical protein [Novosphingobium sp. HII-3]